MSSAATFQKSAGDSSSAAATPVSSIILQEFEIEPTVFVYLEPERHLVINGNSNNKEVTLHPDNSATPYPPGTFAFGGAGDYKLTYTYTAESDIYIKRGDPYVSWTATDVTTMPVTSSSAMSSAIEPSGSGSSSDILSSQGSVTNSGNTTSAPTSSSTPKAKTGNKGVSSGAAAGIAIGCLIAGALLAGIAVWFCLRRARRSRRGPAYDATSLDLLPAKEKEPIAKTVPVAGDRPLSAVMDTALPQPLEDKAISSGISGIGNAIKNHVQSFYHSSRVNPVLLDHNDLRGLGSNLPISTETLSTLLSNPDTREMALRFCIAWVVLSRMQLSSPSDRSFLPREVVECYEQMLANRDASQNCNLLLCRWRMITAHLFQATYVQNPFTSSDPRLASVERALEDLENILRPFADPRNDNKQRIHNLREMFKRAANFAFTMFSQPSTFDFDWQKEERAHSETLCIFPALVQTRDETGERVSPPRAFSEAVSRPL